MFHERIEAYRQRVDRYLDDCLPNSETAPSNLHDAMRYAVFNGGKRVRPLLAYASGECLEVAPERVDAPAAAIELIHAFSLVHDDLPAMDDDDLRRGKPTVHRQFDEATAILAADALQPLAFGTLARCPAPAEQRVALVAALADACGSLGMTGGQSLDLEAEGSRLSQSSVETMFTLKTGALISAAVLSAAILAGVHEDSEGEALSRYAADIGLAFQIRDDILDVEGETAVIGKPSGSDEALDKSSYPAIVGLAASKQRCKELMDSGLAAVDGFGDAAEPLRWIAHYIVERPM